MKNKFFIILLSVFSFFFFSCSINASTNFTINYDIHDHFNYFYEQKNNTVLYQYLQSQGSGLIDTINSYFSTYNLSGSNIFITNVDDCFFNCSDIPLNTSYIIYSSYYMPKISFSSNGLLSLYFARNNDNTPLGSVYFDSNMNYISSSYHLMVTNNAYTIFDFDYIDLSDTKFSYLLSLLYYSSSSNFFTYTSNSITPSLRLNKIILNSNSSYVTNDYDSWFTSFFQSLKNTFSSHGVNTSPSSFGLNYLNSNYYISSSHGAIGLFNILNYTSSSSVTIPNNYSSVSFSLSSPLKLFPTSSCSLSDYALYYFSNSSSSFDLILHSVTNDSISYLGSYNSTYTSPSGIIIKINPLSLLSSEDSSGYVTLPDSDFIKYTYNFNSYDNFYNYYVYYNPNCYISSSNYESVSWTNPVTSNVIFYDDSYANWSDPVNVNSSNTSNLITDSDLVTYISGAWSGAKSFINAGLQIVTLSTSLFSSLPSEVGSILICMFSVCIVIIVFKIFRS